MPDLGFVVMGINLEAETDFLQRSIDLLLSRFTCLDCGFVLVLAEVHKLAHRRLSVRGNLNQVKVRLLSKTQCIFYADNTDLFTAGADESNFRNANAVVDAWIANDKAPVACGGGVPREFLWGRKNPRLRLASGGFSYLPALEGADAGRRRCYPFASQREAAGADPVAISGGCGWEPGFHLQTALNITG